MQHIQMIDKRYMFTIVVWYTQRQLWLQHFSTVKYLYKYTFFYLFSECLCHFVLLCFLTYNYNTFNLFLSVNWMIYRIEFNIFVKNIQSSLSAPIYPKFDLLSKVLMDCIKNIHHKKAIFCFAISFTEKCFVACTFSL